MRPEIADIQLILGKKGMWHICLHRYFDRKKKGIDDG